MKIKKLREQQQDQLQKAVLSGSPRVLNSPPASRKLSTNSRGVAMDDFNDEDDSDIVFK